MSQIDFDLIIVGGGPAGASAAVYASRKQLKTLLLTSEWGGQSVVSPEIQNWIGTPAISGAELAKALQKHVETYAGTVLTIQAPALVESVSTSNENVTVSLKSGVSHTARALLVATGSARRKLEAPGAAEFEHKGLTYCASCDGPMYAGMDVAVVGGGNAAFETALQLLAYCKSVTLLNRSESFRADEVTVAAARTHASMKIITNAEIAAVEGSQFVTGIRYRDAKSGVETTLPVSGIFVEIGLLPNTLWLGDVVKKDATNHVIVDPRTQRTSNPRIWAAGDCTDGLYHQNNIAAGDSVKALEDLYIALKKGL